MPATLSTDVLTPRQLAFIAERPPEPPPSLRGRRAYSNCDLLPGILRVLRSGCRWRDRDRPGSPSGVTHWRRLRFWHRRTGYRKVWRMLLNLLVQSKRLDCSLVSLDGTLIPSQKFTEQTGYSGKHRAVGSKLSLLVDRAGTPLAVSVAPGNYHDGALGFLTVANIFKPLPILRDILAGPVIFRTSNTSAAGHPHVNVVVTLQEGLTPERVIEGEVNVEEAATGFFGAVFLEPGEAGDLAFEALEPGTYFLVCDVETEDGTPHFELGMVAQITVE